MLVGIAHGTVHLMHLFGNNAYRLAYPGLGGGNFLLKPLGAHGVNTRVGSPLRSRDLCTDHRQRMLNGLKLANRASELAALSSKLQT